MTGEPAQAAAASPGHLVIAAVYGANGDTAQWTNDWVELYNPTDADIVLGTKNGSTVTSNYYQCYRGVTTSPQKCTTTVGLYGTVKAHHYFLVWYPSKNTTGVTYTYPDGLTPDIDVAKKSTANGNQVGSDMGGCTTGGQLLLLNSTTGGAATLTGDLSSTAATAAGVVDAVGWTNYVSPTVTQPNAAETNGSATITGASGGTSNGCVLARTFTDGVPVDTNTNATDFTATTPSAYTVHSQISDHVAVAAVADTTISRDEAMTPLTVVGSRGTGALGYSATGLPAGVTIDPATGAISGTPPATVGLGAYPVTVTVTDSSPTGAESVTTSFTLTVSSTLSVDPIAATSVRRNAALTPIQVHPHGGTKPYRYAATGLPDGLTIDAATGVVSGATGVATGSYTAHVTVTDSGAGSEAQSASVDATVVVRRASATSGSGTTSTLRINEVKASATPAQDWVELVNTGAAISAASVSLTDSAGDSYTVPTQDIAAGARVVIDGADLHRAGLDLGAKGSVELVAADDSSIDETSWDSVPTTWARYPDATGDFEVSAYPTKGATNAGPPTIKPNDLLVSEVNYDNNSTDYYEYSEVTNTTDHPIDFSAYGLTMSKSGVTMTFHDPSDTSAASPVVDPVIPAHGTQVFWWVENQYFGVKTTAQFRSNYGLDAATPVILVMGFSSMANSGGDRSYDISVFHGTDPITRAWVDTPCAANTFNGKAVCTATNGNYAEHYAVPADRTNAEAAVWYNSIYAGGDTVGHSLAKAVNNPGTVDLEQLGFSRALSITATSAGATVTSTATGTLDLSGYALENKAGQDYTVPAGTTLAAGAKLTISAADLGFSVGGSNWVSLLAPRGYAYNDGIGLIDSTGPLLSAVAYDSSTGGDPVIDETTGLPLPPAGGLYRPGGISAAGGTVYISNTGDNVLASITAGVTATVAGSLTGYGDLGDGGKATDAQLYQPGGTASDAQGNLYIADSGDNVIRVVGTDGVIRRFAGTGLSGGDAAAVTATSTATSVNLWHPTGVAVDAAGNVFIADTYDNRILKVTPAGVITLVAGTGKAGYTGDGKAATAARLSFPAGIAVDARDNVYVADSSNNVVRRVDAGTGVITTVAGDYAADQAAHGCLGGFAGDGGPATSAQLNDPQGIALDGAGNLFIADTFNHAVRQVSPDGTISTLANSSAVSGKENLPLTGGQYPWNTHLNTPIAVAVDRSTNVVYIADTKNNAVAQVANAAQSGTASGPIEPAAQVAITGSGTAFTACAALTNGPIVSTGAPSVTGTLAVGSTLTAQNGTWTPAPEGYTYQWLRDGVAIAGATGSTYTTSSADGGHVIAVAVTALNVDYASTSVTSAAVSIPVPPVVNTTLTTATPSISGRYTVGSVLTAKPGTWKADAATVTSFTYQWLRNGVAIPGATRATYTLTATDLRAGLAVRVSGSYPGFTTASVQSAGHAVAAGALTTAKPRISGKASVGRTLRVTVGTWRAGTVALGGTHLRIQWYANGKRIAGATKAAYKVGRKVKHRRITVTVTGSYAGYTTVTVGSGRTRPVR
ncbi:putative Ig domain-containing protein [Nocardioides sp.]|uniref:NHL domain-containing protein n=1 Tax=Nocardioides sp. TaxID=35761 RepID=UPI00261396BA|nr:putative Ig domain-containing protein [Nocardioides sp.]